MGLASKTPTEGTQSIRRAIAVLRTVASGQDRGVRLADIAAQLGLARSTVHRMLGVLLEEGVVERDTSTGLYLIGSEVPLLGLARRARFPLRAIAEPHLRYLAQALGDTTFLTIRKDADSIMIERYAGVSPVKVLSIEVGARRPLGVGASGLVLLGSLPAEDATEIVNRNSRRLQRAGIEPADLLERARIAEIQGYAYARVGLMANSRALALPVRLADGRAIAAIGIVTITKRLPDERVSELVEVIRARACAIAALANELAGRAGRRAVVLEG
jgi:DNA-binding IclR family transcriptional regulator